MASLNGNVVQRFSKRWHAFYSTWYSQVDGEDTTPWERSLIILQQMACSVQYWYAPLEGGGDITSRECSHRSLLDGNLSVLELSNRWRERHSLGTLPKYFLADGTLLIVLKQSSWGRIGIAYALFFNYIFLNKKKTVQHMMRTPLLRNIVQWSSNRWHANYTTKTPQ
jgi:hypothetical protein